ncbi:MAG: hypothetical protein WBL80_04150 [Erysipelotrichaceae bacterium]
MQEIVVRVLTLSLISLVVTGTMKWLRNRSQISEEGIVKLPRLILFVGILMIVFFGIFALIIYFVSKEVWVALFFLCISLSGAFFIIAWLNGEIIYDKQYITRKTFFGRKQTYSYYDITKIRESKDTRIFFGKHSIFIDEIAIGGRRFINFTKIQYANTHDGFEIPKAKRSRLDLFDGHVDSYGEFVFFYVLFYAIIIGFTVFIAVISSPISIDNLEHLQTTFTYYQIDKKELIFYKTPSDLTYVISSYEKYTENQRFY